MEANHVSNHDWRETINDILAGWIKTTPLTYASPQISETRNTKIIQDNSPAPFLEYNKIITPCFY